MDLYWRILFTLSIRKDRPAETVDPDQTTQNAAIQVLLLNQEHARQARIQRGFAGGSVCVCVWGGGGGGGGWRGLAVEPHFDSKAQFWWEIWDKFGIPYLP